MIKVFSSRDIEQYYSTQIDEMPMNGRHLATEQFVDCLNIGYLILMLAFLQLLISSRTALSLWEPGPTLFS